VLILLFATIGIGTPVWYIVGIAFCYGFFSSLQFTSMNTLVYADIRDEQTSSASSIASTMQQMSMSFGVAAASLATAVFLPDQAHVTPGQMIQGIHKAFVALGGWTMLSTVIFLELKRGDGDTVSRHREETAKTEAARGAAALSDITR
jgi:glycine/D-amino acid oxidase-like deaminating enzyme